MEVSVLKRTGRYAPCLICPLSHGNAVISHLCRLWVCKGGLVLITDCRWPLLLPNIYSSLDIERPWSCPGRPVYSYFCICGANGRIRERGFGDWRIGGPVTVERGGYMRFYESAGEGFVLFSCEALPRVSRIAEGYWNTFGSCQTAQNLSTLAWKPLISHARHNFQTLLTVNA